MEDIHQNEQKTESISSKASFGIFDWIIFIWLGMITFPVQAAQILIVLLSYVGVVELYAQSYFLGHVIWGALGAMAFVYQLKRYKKAKGDVAHKKLFKIALVIVGAIFVWIFLTAGGLI